MFKGIPAEEPRLVGICHGALQLGRSPSDSLKTANSLITILTPGEIVGHEEGEEDKHLTLSQDVSRSSICVSEDISRDWER
eukprot:1033161-Lingulodinium_polyedra.AAC.1